MNWIGLVAIIGAAAWIPQVIFFLYHLLSKPKLKFIPQSTIEVGYSAFGPILNPSFAISTSIKSALIEKIELEVIHEAGAKRKFIWQFLDEVAFESMSPSGEITTMRKNQPAVALKINTLGLAEKKIGFQDILFLEKTKEINAKLAEKEDHIRKTNPDEFPEPLFSEKEWTDLENFIKNEFFWEIGQYEIFLKAYEVTLKEPHIEKYTFELSQSNVDRLERNIKTTQQSTKDTYLFKAKKISSVPLHEWVWIYPSITRQKAKNQ